MDERPTIVKELIDGIHYLHFGAILFGITGLVAIIISLWKPNHLQDSIPPTLLWSRASDLLIIQERREDKIVANVLAVLVMTMASFLIGFYA